jgi:adenosylhomocysteine nucleosidase
MKKAFVIALPEEVNHATEIHGCPILYAGVGKLNACMATVELIQKGYREIINIGSCGSTRHQLGEIIKIGKVYQDIDCSPISNYGITPFEEHSESITLDLNSSFSCFSTDYFYDHLQSSKYSPFYLERIKNCSVFDMELYAIAKVCRKYRVMLSSYKWVSDDGDFSKWQENCEKASQKVINMLA